MIKAGAKYKCHVSLGEMIGYTKYTCNYNLNVLVRKKDIKMEKTDYFFNGNVTIHEGLTTGALTNASMYFTKEYIYVIPNHSHKVLGLEHTTTNYTNSNEFLAELETRIDELNPNEFHNIMSAFLPEKLINGIVSLDEFTIKTGWLTAGIRLKKQGSKLKIISLRPRAQLKELKAFYNL